MSVLVANGSRKTLKVSLTLLFFPFICAKKFSIVLNSMVIAVVLPVRTRMKYSIKTIADID